MANPITGTNSGETLNGTSGDDSMFGLGGNDTLYGFEGNDTLDGGAGADALVGGAGNDTVYVDGSGANGIDIIYGGDGNDVYVVSGGHVFSYIYSDVGDPEDGDPGQDRLEVSVTETLVTYVFIENLTLTGAAAIDGTGNYLDNTIVGNDAANVLDGGDGDDLIFGLGGNDTLTGGFGSGLRGDVESLYGGAGDDSYDVQNVDDTLVEYEGEGHDTVYSSVRWVLGFNFEDLVLAGNAGDVNGFGNALANRLTGSDGSNYLQGFGGIDTLVGRDGNDYYELGDRNYIGQFDDFAYDTVIEGPQEGIDTVSVTPVVDQGGNFASNYTLTANVENGVLVAVALPVTFNLTGNELDNVLTGSSGVNGNAAYNGLFGLGGNDTLNGLGSLDTLVGGTGNDTYILGDRNYVGQFDDYAYDTVIEDAGAGAGIDNVIVTPIVDQGGNFPSNYTLAANVENGTLAGTLAFNLAGNELGNVLTGNDWENALTGNSGNDTLNGGLREDMLRGGTGDDTYILDDVFLRNGAVASDNVVEAAGEGADTVRVGFTFGLNSYTLGANVENGVVTTIFGFDLTGNELNNVLTGNDADHGSFGVPGNTLSGLGGNDTLNGLGGNDALDGGNGNDIMAGGAGNDIYFVDSLGDRVIEAAGGGSDTVYASVSYALAAGQEIETLSANDAGAAVAINLTGNAFGQAIIGNAAANAIVGGAGADAMQGLGGNDSYRVDNAADTVTEAVGGGSDRVRASVSYALAAGAEVEFLTTIDAAGTTAIRLTGNAFGQTLIGNAGANRINGGAGGDTLRGLGGNDSFLFDTALGATNIDRIVDFSVADDTIRLENAVFSGLARGKLAAGAFFSGPAAHDAGDRIVYNSASGALSYDGDGDGGGAAKQFATLATGLAMTNADFFVI